MQAVGDWTTKVYNKLNFELSALQRFEDQSIPHDFLPVHVDGPYVCRTTPHDTRHNDHTTHARG